MGFDQGKGPLSDRELPRDKSVVAVDGVTAGSWIEEDREGVHEFGSRAALLPKDFAEYAVMPLPTPQLRSASPQAAKHVELTEHARWLLALESAFASVAGSDVVCLAAIWTGYRWSAVSHGSDLRHEEHMAKPQIDGTQKLASEVLGQATSPRFLSLPSHAGLDYAVFESVLSSTIHLAELLCISPVATVIPNMIWPTDRAWFMVSDIDADESVVGGSHELMHALQRESVLEAVISPDKSP